MSFGVALRPDHLVCADQLLAAAGDQGRHHRHRVARRKRVFKALAELLFQRLAVFGPARRAPAFASVDGHGGSFTCFCLASKLDQAATLVPNSFAVVALRRFRSGLSERKTSATIGLVPVEGPTREEVRTGRYCGADARRGVGDRALHGAGHDLRRSAGRGQPRRRGDPLSQGGQSGVPLYDRYVANESFCQGGQDAIKESVPTADTQSCRISKCVDESRFGGNNR